MAHVKQTTVEPRHQTCATHRVFEPERRTYFGFAHARNDEGDDGGDRYAEALYTERDAAQHGVVLGEARVVGGAVDTTDGAWKTFEAAVVSVGTVGYIQLLVEVAALDEDALEEAAVRVDVTSRHIVARTTVTVVGSSPQTHAGKRSTLQQQRNTLNVLLREFHASIYFKCIIWCIA